MSCPNCFTGSVHTSTTPTGTMTLLHGLETYISIPPPSDSPSPSKQNPNPNSKIIILTDAFGLNLPNTLLLADVYARKTNLTVLIPSIIPGGGVPLSTLPLMETVTFPVSVFDILGQLRRAVALVRMLWVVIPFARRTRNVFPTILEFVRDIKGECGEEGGGKVGVAGFCWGAMHAVRLCKEGSGSVDVGGGERGLVDACFVAHPAGLKPGEILEGVKAFGTPFSMAVGDRDFVLKKEVVGGIVKELRGEFGDEDGDDGPVKWEVEMDAYRGCGYGFAVRADPGKVVEDEGAQKAVEQAVGWFRLFL